MIQAAKFTLAHFPLSPTYFILLDSCLLYLQVTSNFYCFKPYVAPIHLEYL